MKTRTNSSHSIRWWLASFSVAALPLAGLAGGCVVDADLASFRWSTLFTNEVPLRWDWPSGATAGQLVISGLTARVVNQRFTSVTTHYDWSVGTTTREEVYQLTLTFYDGNDEAMTGQVLRASLAALSPATRVIAIPGNTLLDTSWNRLGATAIIPYRADWVSSTNGNATLLLARQNGTRSVTVTTDSPVGWYGWPLCEGWGTGWFNLSLGFENITTNLTATCFRPAAGTCYRFE